MKKSKKKSSQHRNPFDEFKKWFAVAQTSTIQLPNAMTLATATKAGKPSARIVFLKEYNRDGFIFYTNYESRKGRELAENPHAALLFYWPGLERQIRITGVVRKVPRKMSAEYFWSRSRESQLGAWASEQSSVLASREVIDERVEELRKRYQGKKIPLPPYWGGYVLKPQTFEFWQGGKHRLHDRLCFVFKKGRWAAVRLSP
jgi:pyridoxamine 5'-phosphate oxidase